MYMDVHNSFIQHIQKKYAKWKMSDSKGLKLYVSIYEISTIEKSIEIGNRLIIVRGWERKKNGKPLVGYGLSFGV